MKNTIVTSCLFRKIFADVRFVNLSANDIFSITKHWNFYRRGQLCGRCLRGLDSKTHDELSVMLNQEEYDDISMAESLINDSQRDTESLTQVIVSYILLCNVLSGRYVHEKFSSFFFFFFFLLLFHFYSIVYLTFYFSSIDILRFSYTIFERCNFDDHR